MPSALKGLLARESLAYGLACAETGFVAVRTEAGQRVEGTVAVANALPAGWSDAFLSVPGGGVQVAMAAPGAIGALRDMATPTGVASPRRGTRPALARFEALGGSSPGARWLRRRRMASAQKGSEGDVPAEDGARTVFSGTPTLVDGRAVLWEETLSKGGTLSRIEVDFAGPVPETIDRGLALWIYVEDLAMPRARIRLADLARLGGERPLNLRVRAGGRVRVVLVDDKRVWARNASGIVVRVTV